jgi:hypothetical protein
VLDNSWRANYRQALKLKSKHNKIQLKTKRWYKKREQLFLFRKLTDISKQNTIFVEYVDAPTDCIGSRNTSGWGTDLEITIYSKSSVVSVRPSGYAQTNCIKNRWAINFAFKIIIIITAIKLWVNYFVSRNSSVSKPTGYWLGPGLNSLTFNSY